MIHSSWFFIHFTNNKNISRYRNHKGQNFQNFYRVCYNFWTIYGGFSLFLTTWGKELTSHWTFWKGPILNAGPSEKVIFVDHSKEDHNEQEFKPIIIGGILDLPKKSSKTRDRKWSTIKYQYWNFWKYSLK